LNHQFFREEGCNPCESFEVVILSAAKNPRNLSGAPIHRIAKTQRDGKRKLRLFLPESTI
jgi:hypothetical protein